MFKGSSYLESIQAVKYAFNGIRVGVLALIIKAVISMYNQSPKGVISYIIMAFAFISVAFFDVNAIIVIACCAVVGLTYSLLVERRNKAL